MKPSPQSHEAAPAADGNSPLPRPEGETRQVCAHCRAEIVDLQWFCRLPGNELPTLPCSSACALRYFDRSHTQSNGWDKLWDAHEHRFNLFVKGELWS
ncbi:MAG: hypothetical protein KJ070_12710 [Verrucomicrobia bacterium]|nr:hypothetical protein [Verrucomicrobiota bacterium]